MLRNHNALGTCRSKTTKRPAALGDSNNLFLRIPSIPNTQNMRSPFPTYVWNYFLPKLPHLPLKKPHLAEIPRNTMAQPPLRLTHLNGCTFSFQGVLIFRCFLSLQKKIETDTGWLILLMEEIRAHQLRLVVSPIIYKVLYIPSGCLRCLNHQQ